MNITTRTLVIFLTVALTPIIALGYLNYSTARLALEDSALHGLDVLVEAKRGQVAGFLDSAKGRTIDFSTDGLLQSSLEELVLPEKEAKRESIYKELSRHLHTKLALDKRIRLIQVVDSRGIIVASTNAAWIGFDESQDDYFLRAKGNAYVSDAHYSRHVSGGKPVIAVSVPIIKEGRFLGVVVNFYGTEELESAIGSAALAGGAEIYLFNKDGMNIVTLAGAAPLRKSVDIEPIRRCARNEETLGIYRSFGGEEVLGAAHCLPEMEWTLVVEQSTDEAFTQISALRNVMALLTLMVAGMVAYIAYLSASGITAPIVNLSNATKELASGNFEAQLEVESQDEIGELASSFNAMAAKLKESYDEIREFKRLAESSLDRVVIADAGGRILFINEAVNSSTPRSELIGKSILDLVLAEDAEKMKKEVIPKTLAGGWRGEIRRKREDGSMAYFMVSAFPLRSDKGEVKLAAIIRDITEEKKTAQALKDYAAQLEHLNKLKDTFTDVMRHDLLNPASVIKGLADIELGESPENESLRTIKENAERLIHMIEHSSELAQIESVSALEFETLDLSEVIKSAAASVKPFLHAKKMSIEYPNEKFRVKANQIIEEVFANLISNAIKYSPEGRKILVTIADAGASWRVSVKDWGYGIEDAHKQKIFERFTRADKKGIKGTGLGLAIVKRIVDLHKGKVWVEDNPEGGSIFHVELPKA